MKKQRDDWLPEELRPVIMPVSGWGFAIAVLMIVVALVCAAVFV